jgi:hypothetical protein
MFEETLIWHSPCSLRNLAYQKNNKFDDDGDSDVDADDPDADTDDEC